MSRPLVNTYTAVAGAPPALATPQVIAPAAVPVAALRPSTGTAPTLALPPQVIEVDPSERTTWPAGRPIIFS